MLANPPVHSIAGDSQTIEPVSFLLCGPLLPQIPSFSAGAVLLFPALRAARQTCPPPPARTSETAAHASRLRQRDDR